LKEKCFGFWFTVSLTSGWSERHGAGVTHEWVAAWGWGCRQAGRNGIGLGSRTSGSMAQ